MSMQTARQTASTAQNGRSCNDTFGALPDDSLHARTQAARTMGSDDPASRPRPVPRLNWPSNLFTESAE